MTDHDKKMLEIALRKSQVMCLEGITRDLTKAVAGVELDDVQLGMLGDGYGAIESIVEMLNLQIKELENAERT